MDFLQVYYKKVTNDVMNSTVSGVVAGGRGAGGTPPVTMFVKSSLSTNSKW